VAAADAVGPSAGPESSGIFGASPSGSGTVAKPAPRWGVEDVGKWLQEDLSLGQYAHKFAENAVDGARLSELVHDSAALRNLVPSALHTRRITVAAEKLFGTVAGGLAAAPNSEIRSDAVVSSEAGAVAPLSASRFDIHPRSASATATPTPGSQRPPIRVGVGATAAIASRDATSPAASRSAVSPPPPVGSALVQTPSDKLADAGSPVPARTEVRPKEPEPEPQPQSSRPYSFLQPAPEPEPEPQQEKDSNQRAATGGGDGAGDAATTVVAGPSALELLFAAFDKNGDGVLTEDELSAGLSGTAAVPATTFSRLTLATPRAVDTALEEGASETHSVLSRQEYRSPITGNTSPWTTSSQRNQYVSTAGASATPEDIAAREARAAAHASRPTIVSGLAPLRVSAAPEYRPLRKPAPEPPPIRLKHAQTVRPPAYRLQLVHSGLLRSQSDAPAHL
jgi:hypothetical protein